MSFPTEHTHIYGYKYGWLCLVNGSTLRCAVCTQLTLPFVEAYCSQICIASLQRYICNKPLLIYCNEQTHLFHVCLLTYTLICAKPFASVWDCTVKSRHLGIAVHKPHFWLQNLMQSMIWAWPNVQVLSCQYFVNNCMWQFLANPSWR